MFESGTFDWHERGITAMSQSEVERRMPPVRLVVAALRKLLLQG